MSGSRGWRRSIAAAAITAVACGSGAFATSSPQTRITVVQSSTAATLWQQALAAGVPATSRVTLAARAWRQSVSAQLLDSGWHNFGLGPRLGGRPISVWPTGDLDGDGQPDLMRLRGPYGRYTVATYSSRTGRRLWTNNDGAEIAVPVDLGGVRGGGVLLVQPAWIAPDPFTAITTLNLVLLGADGLPRWTNTRTGVLQATPISLTLVGVPWVGDLDRYLAGGRQALLTGQATAYFAGASALFATGGSQDVSYLAMDDGGLTHVGDSISPAGPQVAEAVGHLNGARSPACFGLGQQLTLGKVNVLLYCGAQLMWSQTFAQHWPQIRNAGDVDLDGVADVYLYDDVPDNLGDPLPDDPGVFANTGPPLLVSGRDGHVLASSLPRRGMGEMDVALGGPAKGQRAASFLRNSLSLADHHSAWSLAAISPSNRTVWQRTFSLGDIPKTGFAVLMLAPAGDVDGDGTTDVELALWVNKWFYNDAPTRTVDVLTGRGAIDGGPGQLVPDSVTGKGEDRDHVWRNGGRTYWSVRRADGRVLYAGSTSGHVAHTHDPEATLAVNRHHYVYWPSGDGVAALDLDAKRIAWETTA